MDIILTFISNVWQVLLELSTWLFLGMIIAGLLHALLPAGFIIKHLGGRRFGNVFKAVAIGVPMPLCSCGVIPTAIGLKKDGASKGAAAGFLISTPQTGVDSVLVSATFLGWPFAIFKVISALISGLIGGVLVNLFDRDRQVDTNETLTNTTCCKSDVVNNTLSSSHERSIKAVLHFAFGRLLYDIYRWLIFGILVAALITTLIPEGKLADYAFTRGFPGMITMLIITLPMYVCATASVPMAASLILAGMSPGTALVFLMAGPTTNVATIGAILKTFGKQIVIIYLATVIGLSMMLGMTFDWIIQSDSVSEHRNHEHISWLHYLSSAGMLMLLARFIYMDVRTFLTSDHAHSDNVNPADTSVSTCCSKSPSPQSSCRSDVH